MNKFLLLSTLAAFSLAAGTAGAVTVTNMDKADASFSVNIGGKAETVTLKENGVYDSKGKDVGLTFGTEKPVLAKADDHFTIKGGKLELVPAKTASNEIKLGDTGIKLQTKDGSPVTLGSPAKVDAKADAKVEAPAKATN